MLERRRLVLQVGAIAFAGRCGAATAPVQIHQTGDQDEGRANHAQPGRGIDIGLEEGGRDDVLNLRRARQRVHREGERTQRNRAGDQALGNITGLEHFSGERVDRKHHNKQRHTAIGQDAADQHDGQHGPLPPDGTYHGRDDGLGKARQLDHFAKHGAEQEHREIQFDEADHLVHEQAGEHGRDQMRVDQQHGAQGRHRGKKNHAEAAVGHQHQKAQ